MPSAFSRASSNTILDKFDELLAELKGGQPEDKDQAIELAQLMKAVGELRSRTAAFLAADAKAGSPLGEDE